MKKDVNENKLWEWMQENLSGDGAYWINQFLQRLYATLGEYYFRRLEDYYLAIEELPNEQNVSSTSDDMPF